MSAMTFPPCGVQLAVNVMRMYSLWQQFQRAQLVEFGAVERKRWCHPYTSVRLQTMP